MHILSILVLFTRSLFNLQYEFLLWTNNKFEDGVGHMRVFFKHTVATIEFCLCGIWILACKNTRTFVTDSR